MEELPLDVAQLVDNAVVQLVCGEEVGEQQLSEIGR
jgi:hypothetical protein